MKSVLRIEREEQADGITRVVTWLRGEVIQDYIEETEGGELRSRITQYFDGPPKVKKPKAPPGGVCTRPTPRYPDGRTGTTAGYMAHYRAGEEACTACMAGRAAYERAGIVTRSRVTCKASGLTGTADGYLAHRDAGTDPCRPCMAAWTTYCARGGEAAA